MATIPLPLALSTPASKVQITTSTKIAWEDRNSPLATREHVTQQVRTFLNVFLMK
jgi:hypothetical protein